MNGTDLRNKLRRLYHRLGLPGILGAVLVAIAVAEVLGTAVPAYRKGDELSDRIAKLRENPRLSQQIDSGPGTDPIAQLAAFERHFPPRTELPRQVEAIHRSAAAEEIQLLRGDYRLEADRELGVLRYQITLPFSGRYSRVRSFLRRVLQEIPNAAIDGISLQRQGVAEQDLESVIRISLFVRESD